MDTLEIPTLESIHNQYRKLTNLLISTGRTITTMESCTSGLLASLITDTEGSSAVFTGAYVTYSNEAKIKCGVPASVIKAAGVYSLETAEEMAKAAMENNGTAIGVGVTGTFGNVDLNNEDSVPGRVFLAVRFGDESVKKKLELPKNITRFQSKLLVAQEVCEIILEKM